MAACRDIGKELCKAAVEEVEERYFGTVLIRNNTIQYGTVLYSTEQYCTVRNNTVHYVLSKGPLRFVPSPPPLYINILSPVVVTAEISGEEARCRIALRERIWHIKI